MRLRGEPLRFSLGSRGLISYHYSHNDRLTALGSATQNRINLLSRYDPAAAAVSMWLQNNQQRFRETVFLPPCISVSVPERQYQQAVEACVSSAQLRVGELFVYCASTETRSDARLTPFRPSLPKTNTIMTCSTNSSTTGRPCKTTTADPTG